MSDTVEERVAGSVTVSAAIEKGLKVITKQCDRSRSFWEIFTIRNKPRHGSFVIVIPLKQVVTIPEEFHEHPCYLVNSTFSATAETPSEETNLREILVETATEFVLDLKEEKGHYFGSPYLYQEFLMVPLWIPRS